MCTATIRRLALMACLGLLVGCSDSSGSGSDTGGQSDVSSDLAHDAADDAENDGGSADTTDDADVGEPDVPDVTDPDAGDAVGDLIEDGVGDLQPFDVVGSPLDELELIWDEPLELCTLDSLDIEAGLARRGRIVLAPSPRGGLTRTKLETWGLPGARVERGMFADQQWFVGADGGTAVVLDYRTDRSSEHHTLFATTRHDLGDAGLVSERLEIERGQGDTSPVIWGGERGDVGFSAWGPTVNTQSPLASCDPPETWEDAVDVITVASENRVLTLIRFISVLPGSDDSQKYWRGARLVEPGQFFFFGDPEEIDHWALYNSVLPELETETVLLDRTQSATAYYTVFGPFERDGTLPFEPEVAELRIERLGLEDETASVTVLDPDDGLVTEEAVAQGVFRRVDRHFLQRHEAVTCEDVDIFAVGEGSFEIQVAMCPSDGASGIDMVAAVPVAFMADPEVAGQVFSGDAISRVTVEERPGFRLAWDDFEVDLTEWEGGDGWFYDVRDGDEVLVESLTFEHDLQIVLAREERLVGGNEEAEVISTLVRRWAAQGVGESSIYAPTYFSIGFDGEVHEVWALDRFDYTNTHHNWQDELVAETDELRLYWKYSFFPGPESYTVWAETLEGVVVLEETEIEVVIER